MSSVDIRQVSKRYGNVAALDSVSLELADGKFFGLLGPSGSGKTTLLRSIAGFVEPDAGEILIDGVDVSRIPTHRRDIGMVFQNYALFPHMSVFDNVAFALSVRRIGQAETKRRVAEILELVQLGGYDERRPRQLSGGQQQRVALARALVSNPRVLLLDEPLGALDKNLRQQMQVELRQIQREVGITTVLVTHDQEEALTLSDQIAVLREGRLVQTGKPDEVYERPRTAFAAEFLGATNFLSGRVGAPEGRSRRRHSQRWPGRSDPGSAASGRNSGDTHRPTREILSSYRFSARSGRRGGSSTAFPRKSFSLSIWVPRSPIA